MRNWLRLVSGVALGATLMLPVATAESATTSPSRCVSSQMHVSRGEPSGAAGTIYYPIVFTNAGGTCVLWGVPSVQPVTARRRPVGPRASSVSVGMLPARHVLRHGQAVSDPFGVAETGNYPASLCAAKSAAGIVVTLAPFVRSTYVRLPISVCTKQASTRTALVVAGRTGA